MKHDINIIFPQMNGQSMTITVDGKEYHSLNEFRCFNRISESQITKYRKETNCSLEVAIDDILCKIEKRKESHDNRRLKDIERMNKYVEAHKFIYKGEDYESFADAIRQISKKVGEMNPSYISLIAKKNKITKQEAIDLFLERRKLYTEKQVEKYIRFSEDNH